MENDHQIVKNDNIIKTKSGSLKLFLSSENKEELNMETMNTKNAHTSQVSLSSNKGITTSTTNANSNSPKMGSRRIFTPQFKLQVLESYRNDNDCKGNQRATARKYNIHRRQIQKWLQCESSLRSSVANINHTSIKHQFHNVNMQQQQQSKNVGITSNSVSNSSSHTTSQLHSTHLCLDSSRGSAPLTSIKVPSLSSCVTTPSSHGSHDIFSGSNLAAVAAAAAGSVTITSPSDTSSAAVVSPLRPSVAIISNRNTNAPISSLLRHHYVIPSYSTMSSSTTVPILAHHLSNPPQHMHQHTHPAPQTSYQYHNMMYSPTLSNLQTEKQQTSSYFTPISLPTIHPPQVLSSSITSSYLEDTDLTNKLDLMPMETKTYPKFVSDKNAFFCDNNQFHTNYECPESAGIPLRINQLKENSTYSTAYTFAPMDLSVRHRRDTKSKYVMNTRSGLLNAEIKQSEISERKMWNDKTDVVDLTYRKRRVIIPHSSDDAYREVYSDKHLKLSEITSTNFNEDDDIEIEVGIEEKCPPSSKPVKLFKPYLLDECESKDNNVHCNNSNKFCKHEQSEQLEQILPNSSANGNSTTIINSSIDAFVHDNTFQEVVKENFNTCGDSTNFLVESRCESPRSACSPATSVPTMSPMNFQCPKGSPASSGYESSTSSYSESSSSSRNETFTYGQTYCVNLQMQSIYNENTHVMHPSNNVQRWLEKDDSKPLTSNSSISLLV
ncbi:uncharacterized threonine-rich GPI-anchored glycoprotein PJ4664.02 [Lucilia cuprina]|uniref:uncharacterized threonine-rich GPI-anchored glycoprotein PJ4664.02 n=1 Tax=Lucilia cuprina TaxID=7375 RepID=UPI001F069640|nr:uncharacterized threonine-rich GPI-anchored glycoprotein PJ4664.02 [Lucilia cuprina]